MTRLLFALAAAIATWGAPVGDREDAGAWDYIALGTPGLQERPDVLSPEGGKAIRGLLKTRRILIRELVALRENARQRGAAVPTPEERISGIRLLSQIQNFNDNLAGCPRMPLDPQGN